MNNFQIHENSEEGFRDLGFQILKYWQDDKRNHIVSAWGWYKDNKVGFEVVFLPDMEPGVVDGKFNNSAFYPNGIKIQSIGDLSDKFVVAISELYGTKSKSEKMVDSIQLTSIALDGNPQNFCNESLKFKVFFDDNIEKGLYFEAYININLVTGTLEFNEKDIEYRRNIHRALVGALPNILVRTYKRILKKI